MRYLQNSIRAIVAASVLPLSFVTPVVAQQEVSPDHFDAVSIQDQQAVKSTPKAPARKASNQQVAKKRASKVQHARTQTSSAKKVSS
jgi:hypothetical protein